MTRTLIDIPLTKIAIEHYLFDLDQSIEKTSEILGEDEEYVRSVHDDYMRFTIPTRNNK